MNQLKAVILAAGKGTRMKSDLPKVVHTIEGKCLVDYAIEAARGAGARQSAFFSMMCCMESTAGGEKAQLIIVVGKRSFLWYDAAWNLSYPEYS